MSSHNLKHTLLILFLIIITLFGFIHPVLAVDSNNSQKDININDITTNSSSCLLMDAKTGKIIYAKNAYEKLYPASTTKLMTAILTLENCKLTDTAIVSHNAIYSIPVGYSHASLKEDEELTIEQLLNVLLIPSANDAAIVLAEHISGSVEEFSKLMNEKAKSLGCLNTNFVNPNGIQNKNHYSTAYDLALIGKYALKFPDIKRIAMVKQYTLPTTNKYDKTDRIFNATNGLINDDVLNKNYYEYATGLKTGYTDASGYCIVSTAKKDDKELIAVILNSDSISKRYSDCKTLFNYGFDNYEYITIQDEKAVVKQVEIENGSKSSKNLNVVVKDKIEVFTKNDTDLSKLEPTIEINENLKAPLAENTVIGKITYNIDSEEITSDLISGGSVYPSDFEITIFRILLLFLILYAVFKLLKHFSKKKPNNRNSSNKRIKSKSSSKERSSHKGRGKLKFTQISDYF